MKNSYVLDASVAAKWFLDDEELVEIAREFLIRFLKREIVFYAPSILKYEIGHLLTRAYRTGERVTKKECEKAYKIFCTLPIKFYHLTDLQREKALNFANRYYRGFYDSCYLILAQEIKCRWLVSERRYKGALPKGFPTKYILTLESIVRPDKS